jgi:hypothetical protein
MGYMLADIAYTVEAFAPNCLAILCTPAAPAPAEPSQFARATPGLSAAAGRAACPTVLDGRTVIAVG